MQPYLSRNLKTGPGLTVVLAVLLYVSWMSVAFGFGRDGHMVVCEIAFQQLQAGPRASVLKLLGASEEHALARACLWPDEVKYLDGYEWSRPLHYINLPRDQRQYDQARDCPDGVCILAAINRFVLELAQVGNDDQQRTTALRFVGHLVGDLHQPLHTGFADDRGGNNYQVSLAGEGTNLHSVWDWVLVAELGNWPDLVDGVADSCQVDRLDSWRQADFLSWFAESRELVMTDIYPAAHKLDQAYLTRFAPVIRQRLCLAGKRLGWLLNSVLDEQVQP